MESYYEEYKQIRQMMHTSKKNLELLDTCYEIADRVHQDQTRQSGEPYMVHPVAVAKILALLHFNVNVVGAALLHDVLEDGVGEYSYSEQDLAKMTNYQIAHLVNSLTAIKEDADLFASKEEMDELSLQKFMNLASADPYPYAYYIKLADRLHNLRTLKYMKPEKQINKIKETRRLLLPIAKKLKASFFVSQIENVCFQYENPVQYELLNSIYETSIEKNRNSINELKKEFISLTSGSLNTALKPVLEMPANTIFDSFYIYRRSIYEVYKYILSDAKSLNINHVSFKNQEIPIMNFALTVDEKFQANRLHLFFKFYNYFLYDKGYLWIGQDLDPFGIPYVLLKDRYQNVYKILLQTQTEKNSKDIGNIRNLHYLQEKSIDNIDDCLESEMIVIKKDGKTMSISDSATALDFAFEIHTDIGLCAEYAIINGHIPKNENEKEESLYRNLHAGDCIEIVASTKKDGNSLYHAKFKWFLHVNNRKSKQILVTYFNKVYGDIE